MIRAYLTLVTSLLTISPSLSDVPSPILSALNVSTDSLDTLFDDYFQWKCRTYPEWATEEGVKGYDHLVQDFSMEAIRAKAEMCQQLMARSQNLTAKSRSHRTFQQIFEAEVQPCADGLQFKGYLFPPVASFGYDKIQRRYSKLVENADLDSLKAYQDLLERLTKLPNMIEQIIVLLRMGLKEGVTFAKEAMKGVDQQLQKMQVDPNDSVFYSRFRDMSGSLGRHVVDRIQQNAFNLTENGILPAFRNLQEFLRYEYAPNLRENPGMINIPNGDKFYLAALKSYGVDFTPEELKKFGEEEIESLLKKANGLITDLGFNMTFSEFSDHLRKDPQQKFQSKKDALSYFEQAFDNITSQLPKILPSDLLNDELLTVDVKESDFPVLGFYSKNVFYIGLDPLDLKSKYEVMALTLHESLPGHHLQFRLLETLDYPDFIRKAGGPSYYETPSRIGFQTVNAEGWGLYSEVLGYDMGLYEDKYAEFGYFSYNLLRAARLVVDTGLHAFGWSRQKAIQYLLDNTPLSERAIKQEVDRYISIPGQATTYKVGERNIHIVKEKAMRELGDAFDLREFHRVVVTCFGPLSVLESCVDTWVASGGGDAMVHGHELDYAWDDDNGANVANTCSTLLIMTVITLLFSNL